MYFEWRWSRRDASGSNGSYRSKSWLADGQQDSVPLSPPASFRACCDGRVVRWDGFVSAHTRCLRIGLMLASALMVTLGSYVYPHATTNASAGSDRRIATNGLA